MMYYVLAGLQPEGIMARRRPLTSIYGHKFSTFSPSFSFIFCFFLFFLLEHSCKVTAIPIEVYALTYI